MLRIPNPAIWHHNPDVRPSCQQSTLGKWSKAKSDKELRRVVPIIRDLEENGKVIACSTWVVDPLTGKAISYTSLTAAVTTPNNMRTIMTWGSRSIFSQMDIKHASDRKHLIKGVQSTKEKGYNIVHNTFHENIINVYDKVVHGMAFTTMRYGLVAANGTSIHRLAIAPEVKWTSDHAETGLRASWSVAFLLREGSRLVTVDSSGTTTVAAMYKDTETHKWNIEAVVKVVFPDKYEGMKAIWSAGKIWLRQSGCHNARAIVYNLPVLPHWDETDFGVSVLFPAGGSGVDTCIPQFRLIFDALTVLTVPFMWWVLADKEPGWALNTNFGRFLRRCNSSLLEIELGNESVGQVTDWQDKIAMHSHSSKLRHEDQRTWSKMRVNMEGFNAYFMPHSIVEHQVIIILKETVPFPQNGIGTMPMLHYRGKVQLEGVVERSG
ncbi:hypothetical protein K438DRAFT_1789025 [Mycena galopus ATCC 62051]|nr:hypothetical protein K438DRAFT_1789025 [Mycena galopus ATCC 62051]